MSRAHRVLAALSLAGAAVLLPAAPVAAEEPERTGWWSRLAAGGTALPAPTTAEGDLRVAQGPDGPAAVAAVLYPVFGATAATLTLQVRSDRSVGTPDVLACVLTTADWAEGGNQPYDQVPEHDCDAGSAFAEVAPDGSTLIFLLDTSQQDATGSWALALVPAEGAAPFTVDLAKPEADAFVAEGGGFGSGEPFQPEPFEPSEGSGSGADGSSSSSGDPFLAGGFDAPAASGEGAAEMPPLVAGDAAPQAEPGPVPALAGALPAGAPVLRTRPVGVIEDTGTGTRLLALLVLAGGSAALGYAAGQQRPGPRLIGGRARVVGSGAGPVPAAAALVPVAPAQDRPRGIGRFAKTRDSAPRRLR